MSRIIKIVASAGSEGFTSSETLTITKALILKILKSGES
jgi:hypothetical protein